MTCEQTIDEHVDVQFGPSDEDEKLNDLLARWHVWASDERTAVGYPTVSPACKHYRASRQYDSDNGAFDQDRENDAMEAFDYCVLLVQQPHRTALAINARNLATGCAVWRSPRLPEDELARALMVSDARAMLVVLLRQRGVM